MEKKIERLCKETKGNSAQVFMYTQTFIPPRISPVEAVGERGNGENNTKVLIMYHKISNVLRTFIHIKSEIGTI